MGHAAEKFPIPEAGEDASKKGSDEVGDLIEGLASDAEGTSESDEDYYEEISVESKNDPEANIAYKKNLKMRIAHKPVSGMKAPELLDRFNAMMEKAHAKGGPLGERMKELALNSPEAKRLRELEKSSKSKTDVPALKKKLKSLEEKREIDEIRKEAGLPKNEEVQKEIPVAVPQDPELEKAFNATRGLEIEIENAKSLAIPNFDALGYERAAKDVVHLEGEMKKAGFFKKFGLRRKLKMSKARLQNYEEMVTDAKLDMQRDKRTEDAPELSEEEQQTKDKRFLHRQGMKR